MSQMIGADPDELDRIAQKLDQAAGSVTRIRSSVGASVQHAPWEGRNADRFRGVWSAQHVVAMRSASEFLRSAGGELRLNADQQRDASRDTGSGPMRGGRFESCRETPETVSAATRARMEQRRDELRAKRIRLVSEEWELQRLNKLLSGDRQFLAYSGELGDHRITEVYGDLSTAKKVVIHIPGMTTNLDHYTGENGHADAHALYQQVQGSGDVAVISFADYDIPGNLFDAASGHGADIGAERLRALVTMLRAQGYDADDISVVAHSYGTVVAGHALQLEGGLDVGRVVALGSPGMGASSLEALRRQSPGVQIYADAAHNDLVDDRWASAPGIDVYRNAHGPSPTSFDGVRTIGTDGASGHSEYFKGASLKNVIRAAVGERIFDIDGRSGSNIA